MPRRRQRRGAGVAATAALLLSAVGLVLPAPAGASERVHPPATASASSAAAEVARIEAYWTPQRMRAAPPLDGSERPDPLAVASFAPVTDSQVPPFTVNGRIFVRQGRESGFCSGTAINSPTRRLVLTAGHCVNTGPLGLGGRSTWTSYLEFVPAYTGGLAPFGIFVARRPEIYALKHWVKTGNSNYDVGAALVGPNAAGVNVADAVGGGVTIGMDLSRKEEFQTFGYPGKTKRLQECDSPATGKDRFTFGIPGPPTVQIRCDWIPGASGGGWFIENGTVIDGVTSYGRSPDKNHTYGPYFSSENVGALVRGL